MDGQMLIEIHFYFLSVVFFYRFKKAFAAFKIGCSDVVLFVVEFIAI